MKKLDIKLLLYPSSRRRNVNHLLHLRRPETVVPATSEMWWELNYRIWELLPFLAFLLLTRMCCFNKKKSQSEEPLKENADSQKRSPRKKQRRPRNKPPNYLSETSHSSSITGRKGQSEERKTEDENGDNEMPEKEDTADNQTAEETSGMEGSGENEDLEEQEEFHEAPYSPKEEMPSIKQIPSASFEIGEEKRETIVVQADRQARHIHQIRDQQQQSGKLGSKKYVGSFRNVLQKSQPRYW